MTTSFTIGDIKALVRQSRRAEAQQLLERLAAAVLPILTRRCFRVRRLLEFFPKNGALLGMNVNRGAKIYVRLRPKQTPESFYPYEALLETLLHELTHMVHGSHNQAFYKYLDDLKHEMESLMVRGLVGEEGDKFADAGAGQRLGGNSVGVPIRVAAVLAAKRREQYNSLLGGKTSRRLGSASASNEVLNPQALRRKVLEAAERRRRDNEHCRNVLREGVSHEVLGIESSDEDDEGTSSTVSNGDRRRQHASRSNTTEIIVLKDEDVLSHPSMSSASRGADYDTSTIIDLLDDEDEQKSDEVPRRPPHDSSGCNSDQEQDRKRQRLDTSDIIDLT